MSVINNVLKDLESRSSQFTPIDVDFVDTGDNTKTGSSRLSILLLTGLLLIIGTGYWYYQVQQLQPTSSVQSTMPEPVLKPVSTPEPQPNQIVGLQIKETSIDVSLQFAMRQKAISFLKERTESSFVYHIKNIESEIDTPRISGNRWIEKLSIKPQQQGIDVTLQTVAGVLVNTEQFQKDGETIWSLRLEKLPDPVVVAKLETIVTEPVSQVENTVEETPAIEEHAIENPEAVSPEPVTQPVETETPRVIVDIKTASPTPTVFDQLSNAAELIKNGHFVSAEKLLQGLLDGPQDLLARKQLLGIYAQPQYSEEYAELARQSSNRYPQQSLFKTEYARALYQAQSYREVISLLLSIEQLDSKQRALIAASYQRIDRHDKAIEHYYHSLKLNQQEARNWIGLGISLEHEAKLKKALQSYQTAARLGNINERLKQFVEQRSQLLKKVMN